MLTTMKYKQWSKNTERIQQNKKQNFVYMNIYVSQIQLFMNCN